VLDVWEPIWNAPSSSSSDEAVVDIIRSRVCSCCVGNVASLVSLYVSVCNQSQLYILFLFSYAYFCLFLLFISDGVSSDYYQAVLVPAAIWQPGRSLSLSYVLPIVLPTLCITITRFDWSDLGANPRALITLRPDRVELDVMPKTRLEMKKGR